MSVFVILKSEKPNGHPEFVGQVPEPLTIQKLSEIAGKVTGGDSRTSIKCCDGSPATVVTENQFVDFINKKDFFTKSV